MTNFEILTQYTCLGFSTETVTGRIGLTLRFVLAISDRLLSGKYSLGLQKQIRLPVKFIVPAVDDLYPVFTENQDSFNQKNNNRVLAPTYALFFRTG